MIKRRPRRLKIKTNRAQIRTTFNLRTNARNHDHTFGLLMNSRTLSRSLTRNITIRHTRLLRIFIRLIVIIVNFTQNLLQRRENNLSIRGNYHSRRGITHRIRIRHLSTLNLNGMLLNRLTSKSNTSVCFLTNCRLRRRIRQSTMSLHQRTVQRLQPPLATPSQHNLNTYCSHFTQSAYGFALSTNSYRIRRLLDGQVRNGIRVTTSRISTNPRKRRMRRRSRSKRNMLLRTMMINRHLILRRKRSSQQTIRQQSQSGIGRHR